jgi:hypothetical protein
MGGSQGWALQTAKGQGFSFYFHQGKAAMKDSFFWFHTPSKWPTGLSASQTAGFF